MQIRPEENDALTHNTALEMGVGKALKRKAKCRSVEAIEDSAHSSHPVCVLSAGKHSRAVY